MIEYISKKLYKLKQRKIIGESCIGPRLYGGKVVSNAKRIHFKPKRTHFNNFSSLINKFWTYKSFEENYKSSITISFII